MKAYCVGEMTVVGVIRTEREGSRMPKGEGGGVDIVGYGRSFVCLFLFYFKVLDGLGDS